MERRWSGPNVSSSKHNILDASIRFLMKPEGLMCIQYVFIFLHASQYFLNKEITILLLEYYNNPKYYYYYYFCLILASMTYQNVSTVLSILFDVTLMLQDFPLCRNNQCYFISCPPC